MFDEYSETFGGLLWAYAYTSVILGWILVVICFKNQEDWDSKSSAGATEQLEEVQKAISSKNYAKAISILHALLEDGLNNGSMVEPRQRALAMGALGDCYCNVGAHSKAVVYYQNQMVEYNHLSDEQGVINAVSDMASCKIQLGEFPSAIRLYNQCLRICSIKSNLEKEVQILRNVARCHVELMQYEEAGKLLLSTLKKLLSSDDKGPQTECEVLGDICKCYLKLKQVKICIPFYEKRIEISKGINYKEALADSHYGLAICFIVLGNFQSAAERLRDAITWYSEIKDTAGEGKSINNLAVCFIKLGIYSRAIPLYTWRLQMARAGMSLKEELHYLGSIGTCYEMSGDYQKALQTHKQRLKKLWQNKDDEAWCTVLAQTFCSCMLAEKWEEGVVFCEQIFNIAERIHNTETKIRILIHWAECCTNQGQGHLRQPKLEEASKLLHQAVEGAIEHADEMLLYHSLRRYGHVLRKLNRNAEAIKMHDEQLMLAQQLHNASMEAESLGDLAACYKETGDSKMASKIQKKRIFIDDLEIQKSAFDDTSLDITRVPRPGTTFSLEELDGTLVDLSYGHSMPHPQIRPTS